MTISKDSPKSTSAIMRQGHTAGPFGTSPTKEAKGVVGSSPKDLKI